MKKNRPITFIWTDLVQEHEFEKTTLRHSTIMAVCFVLVKHADADGQNIYPSNDTMSLLSGCDVKTVRKVIEVLIRDGLLRRTKIGRWETHHYRLIYPSLSLDTYLDTSTISSVYAPTTKGTEPRSGFADATPKVVACESTNETKQALVTQPSETPEVLGKVENLDAADKWEIVTARQKEFLRPYFERGEKLDFGNESRTISEESFDDGFQHNFSEIARFPILSNLSRFSTRNELDEMDEYEPIISALSGKTFKGEPTDPAVIKKITKNFDMALESLWSMQTHSFYQCYASWREEFESGWLDECGDEESEKFLEDLGIRCNSYFKHPISKRFVEDNSLSITARFRKVVKAIDDSRERVMKLRSEVKSVSRSATGTNSDPKVVDEIFETVKQKAEVEKW